MYNVKNILVTTDFSEYSAEALDYAISIADMYQAELHLLHVAEEPVKGADDTYEIARKSMKKFVYEHVDETVWVLQAIRIGHPHEEIVQYARAYNIDLIVIATHGRTGLSHVIMGSIAEKVIRHSPVPVLTVRPPAIIERLVTEDDVVHELHIGVK